MSKFVGKRGSKGRNQWGGLSFLLLLPVMCGVIFLASQWGGLQAPSGSIERQATPFETADYSPWNEFVFAAVGDGLITQIAFDASGVQVKYEGIATARPTIERQPPVGIPAEIMRAISQDNPLDNSQTFDVVGQSTSVAQVATDTPVPTTDVPATATDLPTATATTIPSDTPVPVNTPVPTNTVTPVPTNTFTPVPPTATDTIAAPVVNFGADPQTGSAPLTVNFLDLSRGDITGYSWNFGDGTTSSSPSPNKTFNAPGSYYVRFDVSGPGGTSSAGVTINVSAEQVVQPPPPPQQPPQTSGDRDGDTIPDNVDQCPDEGDQGFGILGNGCPPPVRDADGDLVTDGDDRCPTLGDQGNGVDSSGCPVGLPDSDGDGLIDAIDACPNSGDQGYGLMANGCPNAAPDSDGDGVIDANDQCPGQGTLGNVDAVGCPLVVDSDGDGVIDANDQCPGQGTLGNVDAVGCPIVVATTQIDSVVILNLDTNGETAISNNGSGSFSLSGGNFTIKAYSASANSVVFSTTGTPQNSQPYAINGATGQTPNAWIPAPGTYVIDVTPYPQGNGGGTPGTSYRVTITVNP